MRMTLTFDYDTFNLADMQKVINTFSEYNNSYNHPAPEVKVEMTTVNDKLEIKFTLIEDI